MSSFRNSNATPRYTYEWDSNTKEYIQIDMSVYDTPHGHDNSLVREMTNDPIYNDYNNPIYSTTCFKCHNIEGLQLHQVYNVCSNTHTNSCSICNRCYDKMRVQYFERNYNYIQDNSKTRYYYHTPCGVKFQFE
jgi:hypothetical protein